MRFRQGSTVRGKILNSRIRSLKKENSILETFGRPIVNVNHFDILNRLGVETSLTNRRTDRQTSLL